jgi:hypothetical protein
MQRVVRADYEVRNTIQLIRDRTLSVVVNVVPFSLRGNSEVRDMIPMIMIGRGDMISVPVIALKVHHMNIIQGNL